MKRLVLHILAFLALVTITLAIWHWRFAVVPGALPPNRLATPLVGWVSRPTQQHEVRLDDGTPMLRLAKNTSREKSAGVSMWLGPLEGVRFIHIRCDSRWKDVVFGNNSWSYARFVVFMQDQSGAVRHPHDSTIFAGDGTSDWRTDEVVLELTGDMANIGLAIEMLGKTGILEVRNLSVTAVRQRAWVPAATITTVLGWLALCASLLRWTNVKPTWTRTIAAASAVVAISWITVFPQTKNILRAPCGGFVVGTIEPPPLPPQPTPPVQLPPPNPPVNPSPPPVAATPPAQPAPATSKPAAPRRQSGTTYKLIRATDKKFSFTHLASYAGFTLIVLVITGQRHQWVLPLSVAFLSELVPALQYRVSNWNDWTDLLQNIAGVALAAILWSLTLRFRESLRKPRAAT